jgi:4-amino-4-deoxy-L-arabinose transferase-like glycosyltransferase
MKKSIAIVKLSSTQLILMAIVAISIGIHVTWLILDRSMPSWDDASHLTNALNYQRVIDRLQLFSAEWWRELWAQSPSYTAPFIYLLTVPFLNIFGKSVNSGILVNSLFMLIVILTTYKLSRSTFNPQVSRWASGLCLMFPALLNVQMMYMLDYGIVAMTCLTFLVLTRWKDANTNSKSWQWSSIFGVSFGCLMLSKPTGFLFLLFPIIVLLGSFIKHRNWLKIFQSIVALAISWFIFGGWFGQNWITVITSAIGANAMGKIEGDPGGNTLAGWLYYLNRLPELISLPILVTSIGLTLLWLFQKFSERGRIRSSENLPVNSNYLWLLLYCLGGYFFCSLATNKDSRFILPIFPVLSIFLAASFNLFQTSWAKSLKWTTVGVTGIIVLINLFWIPGTDGLLKIPYIYNSLIHKTELRSNFPHQNIIEKIITDRPYIRSTIGMLASSRELNAENLNLYGSIANFQVYARYFVHSAKTDPHLIEQDLKSLEWYLTKTGDLGYINPKLLPAIEQNPQLQLDRTWKMPDTSIVKLYRRKNSPISVEPIANNTEKIRLEQVTISPSLGQTINTTYQLSGDRDLLQNGLLLLTWQSQDRTWHHDRAIGLGNLYLQQTQLQNFRVTEHSAMIAPTKSALDKYQLTATYLDRKTGTSFPLIVPKIEVRSSIEHSFEPDPISKLKQLSKLFAQGKIDPVFSQIDTLNQYDPTQDYLKQAQQALQYRIDSPQPMQHERGESQLNLRYTLALTQALQRQIEPLLANLTNITQQDAQNPYAWLYLGVVRLYHWQPDAAEIAFSTAAKLPSPPPELATLKLISALFRGDFWQAGQRRS